MFSSCCACRFLDLSQSARGLACSLSLTLCIDPIFLREFRKPFLERSVQRLVQHGHCLRVVRWARGGWELWLLEDDFLDAEDELHIRDMAVLVLVQLRAQLVPKAVTRHLQHTM